MATNACNFARDIQFPDPRPIESITAYALQFAWEYKFFQPGSVVESVTVDCGHSARQTYTCKRSIIVERIGRNRRYTARYHDTFKRSTVVERIRTYLRKPRPYIRTHQPRAVLERILFYRLHFVVQYHARDIRATVERRHGYHRRICYHHARQCCRYIVIVRRFSIPIRR